jgi:hypothetical protein
MRLGVVTDVELKVLAERSMSITGREDAPRRVTPIETHDEEHSVRSQRQAHHGPDDAPRRAMPLTEGLFLLEGRRGRGCSPSTFERRLLSRIGGTARASGAFDWKAI